MTYSQIVQKHIINIEYFYSRKSQTTTKLESQEVFFFQLRKEKSRKCFVKRREIRAGKEDRNIEAGTEVETMGEMLMASLLSYIT